MKSRSNLEKSEILLSNRNLKENTNISFGNVRPDGSAIIIERNRAPTSNLSLSPLKAVFSSKLLQFDETSYSKHLNIRYSPKIIEKNQTNTEFKPDLKENSECIDKKPSPEKVLNLSPQKIGCKRNAWG